ncbi:hypothetical protein ACS0TY_001024 [Phlomoides rotata]
MKTTAAEKVRGGSWICGSWSVEAEARVLRMRTVKRFVEDLGSVVLETKRSEIEVLVLQGGFTHKSTKKHRFT